MAYFINSMTDTPIALASFSIFLKDMFSTPRSIWLMYTRFTPSFLATSPCDISFLRRIALTRLPNFADISIFTVVIVHIVTVAVLLFYVKL